MGLLQIVSNKHPMATWFTSDTHCGNEAIIRNFNRQYKSVGEMNNEMAGRRNEFLCGHVHQQFKVHRSNVNVGVKVWGFTPIDVGEIRAAGTMSVTHA